MEARWLQNVQRFRSDTEAPVDPRQWEPFVEYYFRGRPVWAMRATGHEAHPISRTATPELRQGFDFLNVMDEAADIEVLDPFAGPPSPLRQTRTLQILSPGILLFGSGNGTWTRLDGHLTKSDVEYHHKMVNWHECV